MGTANAVSWLDIQSVRAEMNNAGGNSVQGYAPIPVSDDEVVELNAFVAKFLEYRGKNPLLPPETK